MLGRALWRSGHVLLLVAVLTFGIAGVANTVSPLNTPIALAGDNDNRGSDDNDDDDDQEQNEVEGQILTVRCPSTKGTDRSVAAVCTDLPEGFVIPAVNRNSSPPDFYLFNVDGAVRVIVRDRGKLEGISECNYVSVDGERINANLFEADDISVDDRSGCSGGGNDND